MTLKEHAAAYVKLLHSTPNGWGQHIHPGYGQSHHYLLAMQKEFGQETFNTAIDAAFEEYNL